MRDLYYRLLLALFVGGWLVACVHFPYVVITTLVIFVIVAIRLLR